MDVQGEELCWTMTVFTKVFMKHACRNYRAFQKSWRNGKDYLVCKVAVIIGVCLVLAVGWVRRMWRNACSTCFLWSCWVERGWWVGAHLSSSSICSASHVHSSTVPEENKQTKNKHQKRKKKKKVVSTTQWQCLDFFFAVPTFNTPLRPENMDDHPLKRTSKIFFCNVQHSKLWEQPWVPHQCESCAQSLPIIFCCWFEVWSCPTANTNPSIFCEM